MIRKSDKERPTRALFPCSSKNKILDCLLTLSLYADMMIAGGEDLSEKTITLRVSEEEHMEIKMAATKKGVTIKDFIMNLVRKELGKEK